MKKFFALMLAAVLVMTVLAGCGKTDAPATESTAAATEGAPAAADGAPAAVKIGMSGPLTGGAAVYGQAVRVGMEIAVEEINEAAGDTGLKIDFQAQDDEHDGEKAFNCFNNLKDWGMQIFAGAVTTGPCLSIAPEAVNDQIFMMTPSGSAEAIAMEGGNIYQMCFTDPNQGAASAELIAAQMPDKTIGVIYDSSTDYSTGIWKSFQAKAAELRLNVVESAVTSFTADSASEMNTQLTKCKEAGCDLVFLPIYATEASVVLNNASSMGYAPDFLGCDGMDGILSVEGFDTSLAEGLIMMTPFAADAEDDATKSFVAKYQEKTGGETPNQFAADAYDVIYAIYAGCQAKGIDGSTAPADACAMLMDYFSTATFSGLTGADMTWDANGMVSKVPTAVEVVNGVYVKK